MTDVTTVYICTRDNHPYKLMGPKLVPLSKSFRDRSKEDDTDFIETYMQCPSMTDSMKDTFVVTSPVDIDIRINPLNQLEVQADRYLVWEKTFVFGQNKTHSDTSVQFLSDAYICAFADKPTMLEITPPYMHNSKMYGFAGRYDVHNWFRPISFTAEVRDRLSIKEGEPITYLRFITKNRIRLVYLDMDNDLIQITNRCLEYKNIKSKRPLRELYEKFSSSRQKEKLLKLLAQKEKEQHSDA